MQFHVFVVHGIVVDAAIRRSNPRRHFSRLQDALHEAVHKSAIPIMGEPLCFARVEFCLADGAARWIGRNTRPTTDIAPETRASHLQPHVVSTPPHQSIPPPDSLSPL